MTCISPLDVDRMFSKYPSCASSSLVCVLKKLVEPGIVSPTCTRHTCCTSSAWPEVFRRRPNECVESALITLCCLEFQHEALPCRAHQDRNIIANKLLETQLTWMEPVQRLSRWVWTQLHQRSPTKTPAALSTSSQACRCFVCTSLI